MMKEQDLSVLPSSKYPHQNCNGNASCDQTIDLSDQSHLRARGGNMMSVEELKIRGELEMDIEKDLEEEIKDGIYNLALRLHRLYRHQKERIKKKTLSEVNINIKMEGGTKIEFKEIKKEAPEKGRPRTSRSENMQGKMACETKKFDWMKTLRSGAGPVAITNKNDSSHQARMRSNVGSPYHNLKFDNARRNCTSAPGQRKGNARVENKLLELGWRS